MIYINNMKIDLVFDYIKYINKNQYNNNYIYFFQAKNIGNCIEKQFQSSICNKCHQFDFLTINNKNYSNNNFNMIFCKC